MGHAQDSELIDTYGQFNSTAKRRDGAGVGSTGRVD